MFESLPGLNSCLGREDEGVGLLLVFDDEGTFVGDCLSFIVITDSLLEFTKARLMYFKGEFIMEELGLGWKSTQVRLISFSLSVLLSLFLFADKDSLPSVGKKG